MTTPAAESRRWGCFGLAHIHPGGKLKLHRTRKVIGVSPRASVTTAQAAKRLHHAKTEVDAAWGQKDREGETQLEAGRRGFFAGKDPGCAPEKFPALLSNGVFPGEFEKASVTLVDGERHGHPDHARLLIELTEGTGG